MASLETEIPPQHKGNPSRARCRRKEKHNPGLQNPVISASSASSSSPLQTTVTCKSSISSLFLSTFSPSASKKKIFTSATFRGMGCASHAEVSAPATAVVRSSADWQTKKVRKKKQKRKKQQSAAAGPSVVVPDVWCSPGIGFVADDPAVDCVVARRAAAGPRGRQDAERNQGEVDCPPSDEIGNTGRYVLSSIPVYGASSMLKIVTIVYLVCPFLSSDSFVGTDGELFQSVVLLISPPPRPYILRRSSNLEPLSGLDSPYAFEMHRYGSDVLPNRHYRHLRDIHHSPGGLAEDNATSEGVQIHYPVDLLGISDSDIDNREKIMMLQSSFMMGGPDGYDRYRDWRLDVDNMSYEELLELGDRIGYVNTGLKEDEIFCCLQKMKHSIMDALPPHLSTGMEWKCSICQEEYEADDEVGKLECGHGYHIYCIKQWLLQKNACPVCKAVAAAAASQ
ncbi:hypothetical protein ACLOJK_001252 [Asimina triloba]